jgi:SAM-dependent methyltransferase
MASQARIDSNKWIKRHAQKEKGDVLSIGAMGDFDCEGGNYREYFKNARSYTTSDSEPFMGLDIVLDVRSMPTEEDSKYDCIFCSGVLEHVDDYMQGMREMTRILKSGGTLLLGVPFRQAIHSAPQDFWRFTRYGIEYMLKDYDLVEMQEIDSIDDFPATYWTKAIKKHPEVKIKRKHIKNYKP